MHLLLTAIVVAVLAPRCFLLLHSLLRWASPLFSYRPHAVCPGVPNVTSRQQPSCKGMLLVAGGSSPEAGQDLLVQVRCRHPSECLQVQAALLSDQQTQQSGSVCLSHCQCYDGLIRATSKTH